MTRLTLYVLVFTIIILTVLTLLFVVTKKQKYLNALKKVLSCAFILLIAIVLIFLFLKFVYN
jgi:hypothetical protein